ncbi:MULTISPECIES: hypothetical protein [Bradyrhizobium]|uniref:Uncharacterized protein n=1 Tax=Bradyrhizobium brasilense TaxID=1419277 RepID=A0ABY8JCM5_9BRAD|nr:MULTISPECIES: hypothetical protein [Bradyrhizobium]MCP1910474.1 hypothetical protein [Bradyrhizobium elkanii]KRQ09714.1 hypothetical protein AOQ73_09580 [Bradyrhizobium pachyrhizi]MCP1836423.1 hypothetical protein [Bradyrhizobium sp. USDA 4545]MCP1846486.1 hypothetical protein [Bradyrhizobium sp. USDA 4541]MCP1921172.1 hypothetical protein [Bradyrhizobium sp. USDA 4532]
MTRAITLAALTCFLLAGAAVTAILGRDSLPAAQADIGPVANRASKQDKLAVSTLAAAAFEAPQPIEPPANPSPLLLRAQAAIPGATDTVRQAYASVEPTDVGLPKITDPVDAAQPKIAEPAPVAPAPPKPKAAAKPAPQKSYALLSDAQIAGIKDRLKLSSSQEYYWPAVETALRAVARKIHAKRQGDPASGSMPIDPDSEEVQQLKSAAMPLLFQLREDQKNEVRSLARLIGLERVAAMI